jgi:hypothetical protein
MSIQSDQLQAKGRSVLASGRLSRRVRALPRGCLEGALDLLRLHDVLSVAVAAGPRDELMW